MYNSDSERFYKNKSFFFIRATHKKKARVGGASPLE
jgi:hypothetical protein